jgi:hypothetical protein
LITSKVNVAFRKGLNYGLKLINDGAASGATPTQSPAFLDAFAALRKDQQRLLTINQVCSRLLTRLTAAPKHPIHELLSHFSANRQEVTRLTCLVLLRCFSGQIQLVLFNMHLAVKAPACPRHPDSATICEAEQHGAAAWAHWRLAAPALWQMGVARENLDAIEQQLHPVMWRNDAYKKLSTSIRLTKINRMIRVAAAQAGYNWVQEISTCKM